MKYTAYMVVRFDFEAEAGADDERLEALARWHINEKMRAEEFTPTVWQSNGQ